MFVDFDWSSPYSVCYITNRVNDDGTFISFTSFKENISINTDYIAYIGCVPAVKSYICKTEITVGSKNSADLIKTLKTDLEMK